MKRLFSIMTIVSTFAFVLSILLLNYSRYLPITITSIESGFVTENVVQITENYQCGFRRSGIWFFTGDMPYTGSIIRLLDEYNCIRYDNVKIACKNIDWLWKIDRIGYIGQESYLGEKGEVIEMDRYADLPGVYYRHFESKDASQPGVTFAISLWYPTLLSAILPFCWVTRYLWIWFRKNSVINEAM